MAKARPDAGSDVPSPEEAHRARMDEMIGYLAELGDHARRSGLAGLTDKADQVRRYLGNLSDSYRACCEAHDALAAKPDAPDLLVVYDSAEDAPGGVEVAGVMAKHASLRMERRGHGSFWIEVRAGGSLFSGTSYVRGRRRRIDIDVVSDS